MQIYTKIIPWSLPLNDFFVKKSSRFRELEKQKLMYEENYYSNLLSIIFTWCEEYILPTRGPMSSSKGFSHLRTVRTDTFHLSASSFNVIGLGSSITGSLLFYNNVCWSVLFGLLHQLPFPRLRSSSRHPCASSGCLLWRILRNWLQRRRILAEW